MNTRDVVYAAGVVLAAPIWARKARGDWPARFGKGEPLDAPPPGGRILLHAVSVGEVNALRELVPTLMGAAGSGSPPEVVVRVGAAPGLARARPHVGDRGAGLRDP
ncbi:MAG: glycosyltransferase N-terminal domain-containing protein, partial [Planctomycetota bacterium]